MFLRECPFCSSTAIDPEGWSSFARKGPACDDCGASADTVEIWNTRPGDKIARVSGVKAAMEAVDNLRISEAGLFDENHRGQRGQDRSNALYDAYQSIVPLSQ